MSRDNSKIVSFRVDKDLLDEFNDAFKIYRQKVQEKYKYAFVHKSAVFTDFMRNFITEMKKGDMK